MSDGPPSAPRRLQPTRLIQVAVLIALSTVATGCQIAGQIVGALIPGIINGINAGGGGQAANYPKRTAWQPFGVTGLASHPVRPTVIATADFNADGRPDVLAGFDGNAVQIPSLVIFFQVFSNNTITWNQVTIAQSADLLGLGGLAVGDLNADGRPDVVAAGNGAIFFLRAPTDPTVGNQWQKFTISQSSGGGLGQWQGVRIAQIDNLFQPDIVAANQTSNLLCFFAAPELIGGPNNLTGTGWTRVNIDATTRTGAFGVAVDDVNADGRPDVISTAPGEANARLAWYQNPGGDATGAWSKFAIGNPRGVTRVEMGDLNQDGPRDAVAMNPLAPTAADSNDGLQVVWFQRPSDPTTPWSGFVLAQFTSNVPADIAIADVEANGRLNVITATNNANTLRWFSRRDDVTQLWVENNLADLTLTPQRIATGDFDLNARPDVVTGLRASSDSSDAVTWYFNPQ